MKLVTVADVLAAIGFDDNLGESVDNAVEASIHSATVRLENDLRNKFARTTRTDKFYIHDMPEIAGRWFLRMKLTQGHLTDADVTLAYHGTLDGLTTDPQDITKAFQIDRAKGEVVITDRDLKGQYVSVGYTAGFDVDGSDSELYTEVPDALKRAATTAAIIALDTNEPNIRHDGDAARIVGGLESQYASLIADLIRYSPASLTPMDYG